MVRALFLMARRPQSSILVPDTDSSEGTTMKKLYEYGAIIASVILIAFGIGAVVAGFVGRDQVRDELAREHIVGTPDMKEIANEKVDTGGEAREFAAGIRRHTLEATGGQTYADMPRFQGKSGEPTNDEAAAAVDPKSGEPVDNPQRQIWVTSTALQTALNTSYFAEQVALFSMVMGVALLLTGIGFLVLTLRVLRQGTARAAAA
jgi:hypothetical protein